jgi:hypothetical protein
MSLRVSRGKDRKVDELLKMSAKELSRMEVDTAGIPVKAVSSKTMSTK